MMNTSEVARILGVSSSTIQRWVKHLDLPAERNERGHYLFTDQNIDILKDVQAQIQTGTILAEISPPKENKVRKGIVKVVEHNPDLHLLYEKVRELEKDLGSKADSVTSYQILQHRSEIDELQRQVDDLTKQLLFLQTQVKEMQNPVQVGKEPVFDQYKPKRKKKNLVSFWFGFPKN